MRRGDVLEIGSRTLGTSLPTDGWARSFTADQAKSEVSGGGFQDLGNGAKWATRRWMGKQNVSREVSVKHHPQH